MSPLPRVGLGPIVSNYIVSPLLGLLPDRDFKLGRQAYCRILNERVRNCQEVCCGNFLEEI